MLGSTRKTVRPGDRVTVEVGYTTRSALRPLAGKLRTVEVIADGRALIFEADGGRYEFDGRTVPPVALVEVSIYTDPTTGSHWAQVYDLPPRESDPHPLPARFAALAERDEQGGIASMPSCTCGRECVCQVCGERTIEVGRGLEWAERLANGEPHRCDELWQGHCPPAMADGRGEVPDCCAQPMRLAPVGWVCRADSAHQRAFQW